MKRDIQAVKSLSVNGVVLGVLDEKKLKKLVCMTKA